MWRDLFDDIEFVKNTSKISVHDQFGIFNDEGWGSSISTFLVVIIYFRDYSEKCEKNEL
jgi:hypothetical protein